MAEIKSTLDLVMEKTRGLRMSEAEKDAQRSTEFHKKLNGVVQRFEDGQIQLKEAEAEISNLAEPLGASGREYLARGLSERLGLERDNRPLLELIQTVCRVATEPVEIVLRDYDAAVKALEKECEQAARQRLMDEHRISGGAVVALPEADPEWHHQKAALQSSFGRRLEQALSWVSERCAPAGNTAP